MAVTEMFLQNDDVRLYAIDSGGGHDLAPLLIVPGMAESATEYADLIDVLAPFNATVRGFLATLDVVRR